MSSVVNIAAYKFLPLADLPALRDELKVRAKSVGLKGTILLSPEGVNVFLAGDRAGIDAMVTYLRCLPGLSDLPVKESFSDQIPFRKLLVKIKREIITFGRPEIAPERETSPRISPVELKQWLDEGRPVTLLDTRNDYEVAVGTFQQAVPANIADFQQFAEAARQLPEEWKTRPVVTFCTGGIRCEKAAPWLQHLGFEQVFQLDGGILKYFEECGGAHYAGDCFVFDERAALDRNLNPRHDGTAVVKAAPHRGLMCGESAG